MEYIKNLSIPFYYLYDTKGSELFHQITAQPEYYPFEREHTILKDHCADLIKFEDHVDEVTIVEFGAGYSIKTEILIKTALSKYNKVTFVPIDISEAACQYSYDKFCHFENLTVKPHASSYDEYFDKKVTYPTRVIYAFLGGSLGNLIPQKRMEMMRRFYNILTEKDYLICGFDTNMEYKDKSIIESAYNDANLVTATFILNVLTHIKRIYNLTINEDDFKYLGFYDEENSRIDMGLVCKRDTEISDGKEKIVLKEGQKLGIEYSHKFNKTKLEEMCKESNFTNTKLIFAEDNYYMIGLFEKNK